MPVKCVRENVDLLLQSWPNSELVSLLAVSELGKVKHIAAALN